MRKATMSSKRTGSKCIGLMILIVALGLGLSGCGAAAGVVSTVEANSTSMVETVRTTISPTPSSETVELMISAAASLTEAMAAVKAQWVTLHPEVTLTFNFASSGTLQKQIEEGAAVDLYISAATKQMNALSESGLIDEASRVDLVANSLVLIVPKGESAIASFSDLATNNVEQIALGEPGSVPVGQYAEEAFSSMGILEAVTPKAVYGKDVKTVLSWVESGDAQAGIVYRTDAIRSTMVDVVAEVPVDSHKPIVYPAAVIKNSANAASAQLYLNWLMSGDAKDAFTTCGFTWLAP